MRRPALAGQTPKYIHGGEAPDPISHVMRRVLLLNTYRMEYEEESANPFRLPD